MSIGNGYPVREKRALLDPSVPGIPDRMTFTKVNSLIKGSVTEPFRIPTDGNYRVKVGIINLLGNLGEDLPPGSQNFISVIAGAPIVEKASIETLQTYGYNCDRTRADPNSGTYDPSYRCFYPGDTLQYKIYLKDVYGNPIVGKSVTVTYPTAPNSVTLPPALTTDSNGSFLLTLTPLTVGAFVEKFTLTLPVWNGLGQTIAGQTTFEVSTGKAIPIINIDAANDFALACTNYPIRLSPVCTYDDLSGCDPSGNQTTGYLSNGSIGSLSIIDYAGNIKQYAYSYNHLDQTAPVIGTISLNNKTSDISAYASTSIPLSFSATDNSPAGCTNKQLKYSVDIVKNGVPKGSTPQKTTL